MLNCFGLFNKNKSKVIIEDDLIYERDEGYIDVNSGIDTVSIHNKTIVPNKILKNSAPTLPPSYNSAMRSDEKPRLLIGKRKPEPKLQVAVNFPENLVEIYKNAEFYKILDFLGSEISQGTASTTSKYILDIDILKALSKHDTKKLQLYLIKPPPYMTESGGENLEDDTSNQISVSSIILANYMGYFYDGKVKSISTNPEKGESYEVMWTDRHGNSDRNYTSTYFVSAGDYAIDKVPNPNNIEIGNSVLYPSGQSYDGSGGYYSKMWLCGKVTEKISAGHESDTLFSGNGFKNLKPNQIRIIKDADNRECEKDRIDNLSKDQSPFQKYSNEQISDPINHLAKNSLILANYYGYYYDGLINKVLPPTDKYTFQVSWKDRWSNQDNIYTTDYKVKLGDFAIDLIPNPEYLSVGMSVLYKTESIYKSEGGYKSEMWAKSEISSVQNIPGEYNGYKVFSGREFTNFHVGQLRLLQGLWLDEGDNVLDRSFA